MAEEEEVVVLVVSKADIGKSFAFVVSEVTKVEGSEEWKVEITTPEEANYDEDAETQLSAELVAKLKTHFKVDSEDKLEGSVFVSREKHANDALKDLSLFLAEVHRPTNQEFTERVANALASFQDLDFTSDLTVGELYRFATSIFDMSGCPGDGLDAVTQTWVDALIARVTEISAGATKLEVVPTKEPAGVRALALRATAEGKSAYFQIEPHLHGLKYQLE